MELFFCTWPTRSGRAKARTASGRRVEVSPSDFPGWFSQPTSDLACSRAQAAQTGLRQAGVPQALLPPSAASPTFRGYGLQLPSSLGLVHSGPRLVLASGTLIIATGPALCSPLNGVGWVESNPHFDAVFGLLNQKPTWKVLSGVRAASGSKPKIWSSRMVLMVAVNLPSSSA